MATEQKPPTAPGGPPPPTNAIDESTPKFDSPQSNDTAPAPTKPVAKPAAAEAEAKPSSLAKLSTGEGAGAKDRDEALAKVNHDRTNSNIRAWEENEKSMSLNKYNKVIAKINAWENTKKSNAEAKLRKKEEILENNRAAYVEKMKNEMAAIHRTAEEKRAGADATKGEEYVKADEAAAKYKASGQAPKRFACFGLAG